MSRRNKAATRTRETRLSQVNRADRYYGLIGLGLVLLATFAVYFPALKGAQLWDDDVYITRPALQSVSGLYRIWSDPSATAQYYPLVHTVFWVEHKLWGDAVLGYHLLTMFWHLLSVLLLFRILQKLEIPGALFASAIFALHPVMVESVAWMSEQKNTLSAAFYLAAILTYLRFDESRRLTSYFGALGLFVLALLTKTATVTLPVTLLIIFWWKRGTLSWRRDVWPLLPFVALGVAAGLMTVAVEWKTAGAAVFELTYLERFLLAGRAIWFYLSKLLWPANVAFIYPRWAIDWAQWWQWIFPIAIILTTAGLWALRARWRAPLAAWLVFCASLLPVLGFVHVNYFDTSFVADHFQYLASLAIIVLVAAAIAQGIARLPQPSRALANMLCVCMAAVLAILSVRASPSFADMDTYNRTTLLHNPTCWLAHNNLAIALAAKGDPHSAIQHYETAIRLKPDYAQAHNNYGHLLLHNGQLPKAIDELQKAVAVNPEYASAQNNLGSAFLQAGQLPEAVEAFRAALASQPDFSDALENLGIAYTRMDRFTEAIEYLEQSLRLRPDNASAHNALAIALVRSGQTSQAIEHFRTSLNYDVNNAPTQANLGFLLISTGNPAAAIEHLVKAVQLDPNDAQSHSALADAYNKTGQPEPAIEHYEAALRLNPNNSKAYASLAQALASIGRSVDAIATAEKAIEVARANKQDDFAEQTGKWLKNYRAGLPRATDAVTPSAANK